MIKLNKKINIADVNNVNIILKNDTYFACDNNLVGKIYNRLIVIFLGYLDKAYNN